MEKRAVGEGAVVVAVCAAIEAEVAQLDEADRAEFLAELGLKEPGLDRVIRGAYKLLGLQTFFTAGPEGSARLDRAGRRHGATGWRESFIRTSSGASFARRSSPSLTTSPERVRRERVKSGKLRLEGKEYVTHEGDVMHFRFNV